MRAQQRQDNKAAVATLSLCICLLVVGSSGAGPDADTDGDGIQDSMDNCVNVANPTQYDTDKDGYGNHCDGDYNNDGIVGAPDFSTLLLAFGRAKGEPGYNGAPDCNPDEVIGAPDFACYLVLYGGGVGPSGRACASLAPLPGPCPDPDMPL